MNSYYANRFREVIFDGRFIANTNLKEQLEGITLQTANHQVAVLNSIALLAQHLHYYIAGVKNFLEGGELSISDQYSFDFPPITTESEWQTFLNQLWRDADDFARLIENLPAEVIDEVFVKPQYGTYRRNIDAMIEHCYYHLGQIVLLRKYIENSEI